MSTDGRTPAQQFADHITGADEPPAPEPIAQPIDPRTDNINALYERTQNL